MNFAVVHDDYHADHAKKVENCVPQERFSVQICFRRETDGSNDSSCDEQTSAEQLSNGNIECVRCHSGEGRRHVWCSVA